MTVRRVQTWDVVTLGKSKRTDEGYIVADAVFSRIGCQDYTRRELGLDGDPNETITLYRPPEEVFHPESLASLDGKPLTLNHPPEDVTADTWVKYAVGEGSGVKKGSDGQTTVGKATLRRRDAIDAYDSGTRELSVGYAFDLDMTAGTAPDGTKYQGIQRNIRANHHAVVDEGRCGGRCRVGDGNRKAADCGCSQRKASDMKLRQIKTEDAKITDAKGTLITIPGFDIELDVSTPEGAKAADAVDRFTRGIKDCMAAHDSVKAEVGLHKERADAAEQRLKELDAMPESDDEDEDGDEDGDSKKGKDGKAKLGDRAVAYVGRLKARAAAAKDAKVLDARVAARQKVIDGAKAILGADKFKADGKTDTAIRAEALAAIVGAKDSAIKPIVVAIIGDVAPDKAPADKVAFAFDAAVAAQAASAADGRQALTEGERAVGAALAGGGTGGDKPTLVGRDALSARMFGGASAAS